MARSLTLVGALGYRNLRDHSVAFEVLERLSEADLGPGVVLEDVSYNPIAVVQWLQAQPADEQFDRVIVVSSVERPGRAPGAVSVYEWDRVVPSDVLVQQAVTEAVTGIISLDNTLVIAGYFGVLPASVTIVEIEPLEHEFGDHLSAEVMHAMGSVVTLITDMVHERSSERDLLVEAERLIAELQGGHGPVVATKVTQLLDDIDAVHRAGLTHLMQAIRGMGGDAFVNKLVADPAIRMLLMSYDLVPVDRRLQADEALDSVRGHLHARGVDVETLEVVGGVVYLRLHGVATGQVDFAAVVRDLEEALRAHFIGFQELVPHERQARAVTMPITLRRAHKPVFRDVLGVESLEDGTMRALDVDGRPVLVVRVGQEWLAVGNRCGESPLPLEFSRLDGTTLHCSWHGCQYDVRTGVRLDAPGDRLAVFPISVEDGKVRIAVDVEQA